MTNVSQKLLNNIGVLVPFTRNYGAKLYASEIARLLKSPQKTAARKLDYLQKRRLVDYKRAGKNKYYFLSLNLNSTFSLLQVVECYKELFFSLNNSRLGLLLNELSLNNSIVLFGSYAKGRAKEGSDVDLVVFGRKSKKVDSLVRKYPFEVNIHYITLSLFTKRLKEKQHLAKEIARDHILFGEKEKVIKILIDYFRK